MDDLDDLLDEVEEKFCSSTTNTKPLNTKTIERQVRKRPEAKRPTPTSNSSSNSSRHNGHGHGHGIGVIEGANCVLELDDLLELDTSDVSATSVWNECRSNTTKTKVKSSSQTSDVKGKCFPIIIGGRDMATGMTTGHMHRSCDRLRCTQCDWKVEAFRGYRWTSNTDYLFLRNNMPDFDKLQDCLDPVRDAVAYSCQCSWRSTSKALDVSKDSGLKWVCGKHK